MAEQGIRENRATAPEQLRTERSLIAQWTCQRDNLLMGLLGDGRTRSTPGTRSCNRQQRPWAARRGWPTRKSSRGKASRERNGSGDGGSRQQCQHRPSRPPTIPSAGRPSDGVFRGRPVLVPAARTSANYHGGHEWDFDAGGPVPLGDCPPAASADPRRLAGGDQGSRQRTRTPWRPSPLSGCWPSRRGRSLSRLPPTIKNRVVKSGGRSWIGFGESLAGPEDRRATLADCLPRHRRRVCNPNGGRLQ